MSKKTKTTKSQTKNKASKTSGPKSPLQLLQTYSRHIAATVLIIAVLFGRSLLANFTQDKSNVLSSQTNQTAQISLTHSGNNQYSLAIDTPNQIKFIRAFVIFDPATSQLTNFQSPFGLTSELVSQTNPAAANQIGAIEIAISPATAFKGQKELATLTFDSPTSPQIDTQKLQAVSASGSQIDLEISSEAPKPAKTTSPATPAPKTLQLEDAPTKPTLSDTAVTVEISLDGSSIGSNSYASGTGLVKLDTVGNILDFQFLLNNLSSPETKSSFVTFTHQGSGLAVYDLFQGTSKTGQWYYPENLERDIITGNLSLLIRTQNYPQGEISGRIAGFIKPIPDPVPNPTPTPLPTLSPIIPVTPIPLPKPTPISIPELSGGYIDQITGFSLIDQDTGTPIENYDPITPTKPINLEQIKDKTIALKLNSIPEYVGSVTIRLTGATNNNLTLTAPPYTVPLTNTSGTYTITAKPGRGPAYTTTFTISEETTNPESQTTPTKTPSKNPFNFLKIFQGFF